MHEGNGRAWIAAALDGGDLLLRIGAVDRLDVFVDAQNDGQEGVEQCSHEGASTHDARLGRHRRLGVVPGAGSLNSDSVVGSLACDLLPRVHGKASVGAILPLPCCLAGQACIAACWRAIIFQDSRECRVNTRGAGLEGGGR